MLAYIRVAVTQLWAGKAPSHSNGKWPKRALGAALKRDRPIDIPKPSLGDDFRLVTTIHVKICEPSFGVAPGEREIVATLRTAGGWGMERLKITARDLVCSIQAVAADIVGDRVIDDLGKLFAIPLVKEMMGAFPVNPPSRSGWCDRSRSLTRFQRAT